MIPGTIEETSDELIEKTLDINVKGVLYAIRAVTPIMKKQRYGRIVNVSSITGKRGDNSTIFVYGASKGAVISLTRSAARQLGPFGITVNAIAPHAVMTSLMSYWDEKKKRKVAEQIPVKRLGTVEDMSYLMMFLASDESSFITGETVNINGGYYNGLTSTSAWNRYEPSLTSSTFAALTLASLASTMTPLVSIIPALPCKYQPCLLLI